MPFCSRCGCEIELRFCRRCGAPSVRSVVVEEADSPNRVRISPAPLLNVLSQFMIDALESWAQAMADQIAATLWNAGAVEVTADGGYASQTVPTDVELAAAGGNVTPAELQFIIQQLQKILDSDNEISEIGNMQLQMLMNAGTKLLQLVSEIEDYKRHLLAHQLD